MRSQRLAAAEDEKRGLRARESHVQAPDVLQEPEAARHRAHAAEDDDGLLPPLEAVHRRQLHAPRVALPQGGLEAAVEGLDLAAIGRDDGHVLGAIEERELQPKPPAELERQGRLRFVRRGPLGAGGLLVAVGDIDHEVWLEVGRLAQERGGRGRVVEARLHLGGVQELVVVEGGGREGADRRVHPV